MKTRISLICFLFWALALASCGTVPKTTVPIDVLGPPLTSPNDSLYARALNGAVMPSGQVNYLELSADTNLTAYLREIARVQPDAFVSRGALLAFWINTHNAYVLDMIRENWNGGSVRSIDDIPGFRYAKVVIVGGQRYSLDEIEEKIIGTQFREPRAFFALFDGSVSSPQLRSTPYSDLKLGDQLDRQLKLFLADSTRNYLDRVANTLYLSRVFATYASNLKEAAGGTLASFVRLFAPPQMVQWIAGHPNIKISYLHYDYTINTNNPPPTNGEYYHAPPRRTNSGIR